MASASQAEGTPKKRQREDSNTRVGGVDSSLISDATTRPIYQRRFTSTSSRFNDSVTADVILTLHFESSVDDDVKLYLHSDVLLGKSRFFSAFLSDRWQRRKEGDDDHSSSSSSTTFNVPASMGSVVDTMTIFELFYSTNDDDDFSEAINTVSSALSIINSALQFLFDDCVRACIRFLEAVPWSDEEEKRVLSLIPLLKPEESQEILARFLPVTTDDDDDSSAELLQCLILEAADPEQSNLASPEAFVSMLMRDFSSRDSARRALNREFEANLNVLKESLMCLSCPSYWTERGNVRSEREMTNERHVTWLIEKMIDLRVGETAVKEWVDQNFSEDVVMAVTQYFLKYKLESDNGALGIVAHVIRCTSKLAHALVTGSIIADRQVRMKLVKDWLRVLIVSKDKPIFAKDESSHRDLGKALLRIISTLPMTDTQELLKQCIYLEESPELLSAFVTWFRRAAQPSA